MEQFELNAISITGKSCIKVTLYQFFYLYCNLSLNQIMDLVYVNNINILAWHGMVLQSALAANWAIVWHSLSE